MFSQVIARQRLGLGYKENFKLLAAGQWYRLDLLYSLDRIWCIYPP